MKESLKSRKSQGVKESESRNSPNHSMGSMQFLHSCSAPNLSKISISIANSQSRPEKFLAKLEKGSRLKNKSQYPGCTKILRTC